MLRGVITPFCPIEISSPFVRIIMQKTLGYCWRPLLTTSVCPSVCGCWDEITVRIVPLNLKRGCQNLLVKIGSGSETKLPRILCKLQTIVTNNSKLLKRPYNGLVTSQSEQHWKDHKICSIALVRR